jgi:ubiquinone biosynthesis protein UbiJ
LANRDKVSFENMRSNQQNRMGARLSGRRKNFPLAFQHDTALRANECGGPVVNLDGDVVGVNVARAGRVSSLAIPAHRVLEIIEELGSGAYSPEIVNAKRIREVDEEIDETKEFADQLGERIEKLMESQTDSQQVLPGYQAAVDEMVDELNQLRKKIDDQKEDLEESQREVVRIKRLIKELERERQRLETGVR